MKAHRHEAPRTLDALLKVEADECVIWPFAAQQSGYGVVHLGGRMVRVHRIACELRHGSCPDGKVEVAHSCGVRRCMNYRHLRWVSDVENQQDKILHGKTKLNEADVLDISRRLDAGERVGAIARDFGVTSGAISHINVGFKWSWLTGRGQRRAS